MTQFHATFQLRCHVRKGGHKRLAEVSGMLNTLYNAALQERRDAYRMAGKSINLYQQTASLTAIRGDWPEWKALDVNVARGALRRLDRAMNAFFRRVKEGSVPGFPRFKPLSRFKCIELAQVRPGMVKVSTNGRKAHIRVKGLPVIELRLKRALPDAASLKSLRLVQQPRGWYADLAYAVDKEPLPHSDVPVGIDFGVNNRIALSTGEMIEGRKSGHKSRRGRSVAPQSLTENTTHAGIPIIPVEGVAPHDVDAPVRLLLLRDLRRVAPHDVDAPKIAGCRRNSQHQRKLYRQLARLRHREKIANRNACHRITTDIVRRFGRIAVEKLIIPNMTKSAAGTIDEPGKNVAAKSGLNREILANTWGLLRNQLAYKAEWAGREFVEVNPRYTSRECWACGHQTPQSAYRTYNCGVCGTTFDRDTNAALNVMQRAFGPVTGAGISPALF